MPKKVTTVESGTSSVAAAVNAPLKKATVKKVATKSTTPVKKAATKNAVPPAPTKKAKSDVPKVIVKPESLRAPQITILELLAATPDGLTRSQIAESLKASGKSANLTEMVGSDGSENKYTTTLTERKMVRHETHEDGKLIVITAAGQKALAAALKSAAATE